MMMMMTLVILIIMAIIILIEYEQYFISITLNITSVGKFTLLIERDVRKHGLKAVDNITLQDRHE